MNNSNGIRDRKVKKVIEYLANALYPLAPAERLPGFRTIMKETGTGRRTVGHALDFLVAEGLIKVDPKKGIFRIKPAEKTDEIRLLHWSLASLEEGSFISILFENLLKSR